MAEFLLKVQRHPKFRPKTVKEAKNSLKCIPVIKKAIRFIDDNEKYIEMIIMADENEEFLKSLLNQLQKSEKISK
ncbi:MAG TPA: hypothetical protein VK426_11610 [Methanobacterium sp.]|nr:hypothetical protein [Methanobacterium sp.]